MEHAAVSPSAPFSAPRPGATAHASPRGRLTLDGLLDLRASELEELYAGATTPSIALVKGDLRGRMLAIPAAPRRLQEIATAFARSTYFPWRGKSFRPLAEGRGEGDNRAILDRIHLYRFETRIGPSLGGPFDAIILNYDLPENPFFIRAIQDEIREIAPGLYLGQAYVRAGGPHRLWLYFGLSSGGPSAS